MFRIAITITALVLSCLPAIYASPPSEQMREFYMPNGLDMTPLARAFQAPLPGKERVYTPYDAVKIAEADLNLIATLKDPKMRPQYMRYLDLRGVPASQRVKLKKSIDYILNSLNSRRRKVVGTASLPAGVKDPLVLRVNLRDYSISAKAWDYLAENGSGSTPLPDPYFHINLTTATGKALAELSRELYKEAAPEKETSSDEIESSEDGPEQKKPAPKPKPAQNKSVFAAAPWLAVQDQGAAIASLITKTQSRNPMLNGKWFVTYATWAPAYYFLIGIEGKVEKVNGVDVIKGGEKQFAELAGFDDSRSEKSQIAAIANSKIVTLHNRVIVRRPTVTGYTAGAYWFTKDTNSGLEDEDYMENVVNFNAAKHKAKEIIATWLNELHGYALTNASGDLIMEANPHIATHGDTMPTKLQDKIVYAGIHSCALCHGEGFNRITDQVRSLAKGNIALLIPPQYKEGYDDDDSIYEKFAEAFEPHLEGLIASDNVKYKAAIFGATQLAPKVNRDNLEDFMYEYLESPVTLEMAAFEVGWPVDKLSRALKGEAEYKGFGINLHYTSTMLISRDPNVIVPRIVWERLGYARLMEYLIRVSNIQQKKEREKLQ